MDKILISLLIFVLCGCNPQEQEQKEPYDSCMFYQKEEGDDWAFYTGRENEGFVVSPPQPFFWFDESYSKITIPRKNIKSIKWPKGKIVIEFIQHNLYQPR